MRKIKELLANIRSLSLYRFSQKRKNAYLFFAIIFSLVGYAYLLLFPTLIVVGLMYFSSLIDSSVYDQSYTVISILAASVVISAAMTYFICTIKFIAPKGLNIPIKKYPHLATMIAAGEKRALGLKIHSVNLRETCKLQVEKTPVFGFPIWSRNTLIVGFSYMQCMPPEYLKFMLSRKIKQFGKSHPITSWVYRTEQIWTQYPNAIKSNMRLGEHVTYWFFKFYAPLNKRVALYVIQADELLADNDTLDEVNSEDYLVAMELELAASIFLQKHYWPGMMGVVKKRKIKPAVLRPFTKLSSAIVTGLTNGTLQTLLKNIYSVAKKSRSTVPPLKVRMKNIGHRKLKQLNICKTNAAQYIFAKDYPQIVLYMDKQWTSKMNSVLLQIIKREGGKLRLVDKVA